MDNCVIILAGGKGTRMGTNLPKVLCEVDGKPIIERLLESAKAVCEQPVAVVGFQAQEVKKRLGGRCQYVWQEQQLGTGHAIQCAKELLRKSGCQRVVVLPGDHPLVSAGTIRKLIAVQQKTGAKIVLATVKVPEFEGCFECFWGFGRILRNGQGNVTGIVELKDASVAQQKIKELNTSYYCFEAKWLLENIDKLENDNVAGELYLTDMVGLASRQGQKTAGYVLDDPSEALGVNTPEQLEVAEMIFRSKQKNKDRSGKGRPDFGKKSPGQLC